MANERRLSSRRDWDGYYKEICADADFEDEIEERLVVGETLPDGVFAVERLVTARKRKRRTEYLVLWKGYSREEASWVRGEDLTESAIRAFNEPQPSYRDIADCVSNLYTAIQNSLRVGVVRNCSFVVPFRCDVFNFLFSGKGSIVRHKKGRMYSLDDFDSTYFPTHWFVNYNRLGSGCKIEFPINLRSYVKFAPHTYIKNHDDIVARTTRDFMEVISVSVVKVCC